MLQLGPWKPRDINVDTLTDEFGNFQMDSLRNLVGNFGLPCAGEDIVQNEQSRQIQSKQNLARISDWGDPTLGKPQNRSTKHTKRNRRKRHLKREADLENNDARGDLLGPAYINVFDLKDKQEMPEEEAEEIEEVDEKEMPEEEAEEIEEVDEKDRTTVVVRGIPRHFTLGALYQELYDIGFGDDIDYMNMLEDKKGGINRGYAFVNFVTNAKARQCMEAIQGHEWKRSGNKIIAKGVANWALVQGFAANNKKHPMVPITDANTKLWRIENTKALHTGHSSSSDLVEIRDQAYNSKSTRAGYTGVRTLSDPVDISVTVNGIELSDSSV